jgi:hypothetical protein
VDGDPGSHFEVGTWQKVNARDVFGLNDDVVLICGIMVFLVVHGRVCCVPVKEHNGAKMSCIGKGCQARIFAFTRYERCK